MTPHNHDPASVASPFPAFLTPGRLYLVRPAAPGTGIHPDGLIARHEKTYRAYAPVSIVQGAVDLHDGWRHEFTPVASAGPFLPVDNDNNIDKDSFFTLLSEDKEGRRMPNITIEEVPRESLPTYVHLPVKWPDFDRMLKGEDAP